MRGSLRFDSVAVLSSMYRPNIVILLLLLAIMAGNLAVVTVNKVALDDVEAVAEWRIDADSVDGDLGTDPEIPAALALYRGAVEYVSGPLVMPHGCCHATALCMSTQATRAPPYASPA